MERFYNATMRKMKQPANKEAPCVKPSRGRAGGAAFLLAQLGSHAASQFAARLAELELIPAHAGVFRILAATPAMTQQALAKALGTLPSRLVAIVDELESKGLLERRPHENDRRSYALHVTGKGKAMLQAIGKVAREHQQALLAALSEDEQTALAGLLQRVADQQGQMRGVHPGFGNTGRDEAASKPE
jgi:DNA-binding MarR family transcriptional regulator